jgi:hypothetical protein
MIICTVILALLAVLIATESDPLETAAPGPEHNPSPDSTVNPARTPQQREAPVDSGRTMIPFAGKFRFDRPSLVARASLPFPSTRTESP